MKAKLKFLRLDNETDEDELVFEIIPSSADGVYAKNRWLVRVAKCFTNTSDNGDANEDLRHMVSEAKKQIGAVMGIIE